MFRRKWSGLPADPTYSDNFKDLGYFINEQDEIRNITDPRFYFKYFITKNERWNERQRFAMNAAIEREVHSRLTALGLQTLRLPISASPEDPHVSIFASPALATASRVVLVVGESTQDLGVLAYRVIGGAGGIAEGSMVSVVEHLLKQRSSAADPNPPAIVLANMGQLFWWPEGRRTLSPSGRHAIPCSSAVSKGVYYDPSRHAVEENETPDRHLKYVFDHVLDRMKFTARLSIVALGDGAEYVETFLNDEGNWAMWGLKLQSLAIVGGFFDREWVTVEGFREFLKQRARAYMICPADVDTPVSGPEGNINSAAFTNYGCPVYSSGECSVNEVMFVKAKTAVLEWVERVALAGDGYRNPKIYVDYADRTEYSEPDWGEGDIDDGVKVEVIKMDESEAGGEKGQERDAKEDSRAKD